jgi:hypothetical protein
LGTTDEDERRAAEKLGELFGGGCCRFRWKETV